MFEKEIRAEIAQRRLVIVTGTGVSSQMTDNATVTSWVGLLKSGISRCLEVIPDVDENWQRRRLEDLEDGLRGQMNSLLIVAEMVERTLNQRGGEFSRWLRDTVGSLTVRNPALAMSLRELRAPIITTNYDGLLETALKLKSVTWQDQAKALRIVRCEETDAVLHLHDPVAILTLIDWSISHVGSRLASFA